MVEYRMRYKCGERVLLTKVFAKTKQSAIRALRAQRPNCKCLSAKRVSRRLR